MNKMMMGIVTTSIGIILSVIGLLFGFFLLPILAHRANKVKNNTSIGLIPGLTDILDMPIYGVTFGLTIFGVGTIFIGLYLIYQEAK